MREGVDQDLELHVPRLDQVFLQVHRAVAEGALGIKSEGVLSGLAVAQVEYRRPRLGFPSLGDNADEFANLYNPVWQARLVSSGI